MNVKVKIINKAKHNFGNPRYEDQGSSGMDVRASLDEFEVVRPGCRKLIPTGLFVEIPEGYEIKIVTNESKNMINSLEIDLTSLLLSRGEQLQTFIVNIKYDRILW